MRTHLLLAAAAVAFTLSGCSKPPTFLERSQRYAALVDQMALADGEEPKAREAARQLYNEHISSNEKYDFCSEARLNFERASTFAQNIELRREVMRDAAGAISPDRLLDLDEQARTTVPQPSSGSKCPNDGVPTDGEKRAAAADARLMSYLSETKTLIAQRYASAAKSRPAYMPTLMAERERRYQARLRDTWGTKSRDERLIIVGDDLGLLACMDAALLRTSGTAGVPGLIDDTLTLCRRGLGK